LTRDALIVDNVADSGVGAALRCTIQDEVNPAEVACLRQALLHAGCGRASLADTVGYADPVGVAGRPAPHAAGGMNPNAMNQ